MNKDQRNDTTVKFPSTELVRLSEPDSTEQIKPPGKQAVPQVDAMTEPMHLAPLGHTETAWLPEQVGRKRHLEIPILGLAHQHRTVHSCPPAALRVAGTGHH